MIKYFCDRCGDEFKSGGLMIPIYARDDLGARISFVGNKHLCAKCTNKFNMVKDCLKYEEDFFDIPDDDILIPTSDCLLIGFDNSLADSACMTIFRGNEKNIKIINTFYGADALKEYKKLIGMK